MSRRRRRSSLAPAPRLRRRPLSEIHVRCTVRMELTFDEAPNHTTLKRFFDRLDDAAILAGAETTHVTLRPQRGDR